MAHGRHLLLKRSVLGVSARAGSGSEISKNGFIDLATGGRTMMEASLPWPDNFRRDLATRD